MEYPRRRDLGRLRRCGLAAIRGLTRDTLDTISRTHSAYVAIVNGRDQMVVGGTRAALAAVIHDARLRGAERTTMLPVAVPAHTPLLAAASDRFRQALAKAHLAAGMPSGVAYVTLPAKDCCPTLGLAIGSNPGTSSLF